MKTLRSICVSLPAAIASVLALAITATPASAQATRTWVSGVGNDVDPCSRTAPCKTFAGAISKTAAGGEINCLDPGGYGTLTITKSITIDCTGTFGSTLNSGGINGFVINDSLSATPGASDVILRGLVINGAGTTPGLNGVRFISGRSLLLQDILIQRQKSGAGISFQPQHAGVELNVIDVTITDGGDGIFVKPTGTGSARVTLENVRIVNNAANGFRVDSTGNTGAGIVFSMEDVVINGGAQGISINSAPATTGIIGSVNGTTINNNSGTGIGVTGAVAVIHVSDSTITRNGTGVSPGGSQITSFGNNRLMRNTADGAFSGTTPLE